MDMLTLRELCDEYFRIETALRDDRLTRSGRDQLTMEMAITMAAIWHVTSLLPPQATENEFPQ